MYANKIISGVNIDEEDLAASTVNDDGCGCCMSEFKQDDIQQLEQAIKDMEELAEKARQVLKERKKKFRQVGEEIPKEKKEDERVECVCGQVYNASTLFRVRRFYEVDGKVLCKDCVEEDEELYRSRDKIYRREDQ